jgi:hypothetical protein
MPTDPLSDPAAHAAAGVADPEHLDGEDRRRLLGYERRALQRPRDRQAYMDKIAELDPALYAELAELRGRSPQAWRKRLQREAHRLDLHRYFEIGPR